MSCQIATKVKIVRVLKMARRGVRYAGGMRLLMLLMLEEEVIVGLEEEEDDDDDDEVVVGEPLPPRGM